MSVVQTHVKCISDTIRGTQIVRILHLVTYRLFKSGGKTSKTAISLFSLCVQFLTELKIVHIN